MTITEKGPDTKDAIIAAAAELFSAYGFAGSSVRQIAKHSGVNIAAINYHFGNKHNLYWAVMDRMHRWLNEGVRQLSEEADTVQELTVKAFGFTMENPAAIRTAIKLMMSEGVQAPDGDYAGVMCEENGPPGSSHFARILKKQLSKPIAPQALDWGVHAIFAGLLQWSMICSSAKITQINERIPHLSHDEVKKHIFFQVDAIVSYLESHSSKIENELHCLDLSNAHPSKSYPT